MTSPTETPLPTDSLPPVPRPANARAARRSWNEAPVRIWAILAVIVLLVTIYFTIKQVSAALTDRELIAHGVPVKAHVDSANAMKDLGRRFDRRNKIVSDLTYTGPDGVTRTVQRELSPQVGMLMIGGTIDLRVDPKDPTRWTDLAEPTPWYTNLSAFIIILVPLLLFSVAMMLWLRSRVLSVWRNGVPTTGIVIDSKQSAIAPRSRAVRFALADGNDRRVFHLLYPLKLGELARGEELALLAPRNKPARAIIAALYR